MKKDSLTQSYAQAAYESATDVWLRALTGLQEALENSPGVLSKLRDPGLDLASKQALSAPLLPTDAAQEIRNFVSVLLSRNDIGLLPEIVEHFRRLAIHGPRAQVVRVTSAIELSDEEKSTLAEKLAVQFGANLEFDYKVDSSLLGGLLVRVGDRVIDASVAGKLKALRESLSSRT